MPQKDVKKGDENIRELLEKLRQAEPDMCSELENYINGLTTAQHDAETKLAEAEAELTQMHTLCDNSQQSTIVLKKTDNYGQSLLNWTIEKANNATSDILGIGDESCIGHKLSDYMSITYDIEIPDQIDEDYTNEAELDIPSLNKNLIFKMHGQADGTIVCFITDETEPYQLRNQLNTHLQRFELITESLVIANSEKSYSRVFNQILDRIGFHLSPKRVLVFIDNANSTVGQMEYQWTLPNEPLVPRTSTTINYDKCPSWQKMLTERKMILGFQTNSLPDDIAKILEPIGLKNAYIFPMNNNEGKSYGSILFETRENNPLDNFEINYIRIIATLLSGHIQRNKIMNDLIREKERAEESDLLKSSFLVNMSHDIRIPMNSIIGFSDLLADEDLTQTEREEFIDMINKSGQDLVMLIDNIIDISKIETGQLTVKKEPCPLDALMNDIIATYRHDHKFPHMDEIKLELDFAPKYNCLKFSTDIFRFRQICTNLIDNSLKFTERGYVRFGISKAWGKTIEFYVQDTGIGISEDQQHIIFKRFSKVDRTFANEYNGTGLGLSICKSLVEMLGGEIHVVSVPGMGSTFYFTQPLDCEVPEHLVNLREVKSLFDWKSRKILIVDDNEDDRKYLANILMNTAIEIIWLNTGNEAISYFGDGNMADILLMDMTATNLEAARRIHRLSPVPIVAQSSEDRTDEDRILARKSGCIDLISKPISPSRLLMVIDATLKKW
jgi:signal transduction histidine kinase